MPLYINPAEYLIKVSIKPKSFRHDLTLSEMHILSKNALLSKDEEESIFKYNSDSFKKMHYKRKANFFKEFWLLFERACLNSFRNPRLLATVIFVSCFITIVYSSFFEDIA